MKTNRQFWTYFTSTALLTLIIAEKANAHVLAGETSSFWQGISHPTSGLDHILAMIAVGMWAVQIGGRATWFVPAAFVSAMTIGSWMGMAGIPLSFVERGIFASDFILGILILLAARFSLSVSASIVALLAIFHGYAHGMEMPENTSGLTYAVGFVLATCFLHSIGIAIGSLITRGDRIWQNRVFRLGGVGIIIGTCFFLLGN